MNTKNKNNKLKIFLILDLVLLILFALLFNIKAVPLAMHEIIGFIMLGMGLIHIILHPTYVLKVTKKAFSKNSGLTKKARFSYILNFLLFILLLLMIITSFSISRVLLNNNGTGLMIKIHKLTANLMIAIIGIHLGLHYKMIASKLKLNKVLAIILITVLLLFGTYSLVTTIYENQLNNITQTESEHGQGQGQGKGLGQGRGEGQVKPVFSELNFAAIGYTIISYVSIVYIFCFLTHLIEENLKRKKKRKIE